MTRNAAAAAARPTPRRFGRRYTLTYVNTFQLIGPGPGNNLLAHEVAHMTLDGDDVVVQHDNLSIDCK